MFFFGKLGEPGSDGKRKMAPGLEVEAAVATRARGLGMRVPRVEDAHGDRRVAWGEDGTMWTGAEAQTGEHAERTERNRRQANARRAAAATATAHRQVTGRRATPLLIIVVSAVLRVRGAPCINLSGMTNIRLRD